MIVLGLEAISRGVRGFFGRARTYNVVVAGGTRYSSLHVTRMSEDGASGHPGPCAAHVPNTWDGPQYGLHKR